MPQTVQDKLDTHLRLDIPDHTGLQIVKSSAKELHQWMADNFDDNDQDKACMVALEDHLAYLVTEFAKLSWPIRTNSRMAAKMNEGWAYAAELNAKQSAAPEPQPTL